MASLLAVMYNPNDFFEPESFKPERFFENGKFQEYLSKYLLKFSATLQRFLENPQHQKSRKKECPA